ncbi:MAG: pallilysin-related adhesin, partial [Treponema sp.]|nr:pallilysin-related adhesin [Treponema sp.]
LVPLKSDETLFGTLSMDFDGDGYDDQVNAIKNSSSPAMQLLVGLYNPASKAYERSALLVTDIQQARTFSYTGMDITGDHRTALVYQGFLENGDSVMQVYHILRSSASSSPVLKRIASLRADGTIVIQQIERDDSYLSDQTTGASYVIWVYGSDYANKESSDQLQTRWEWNRNSQLYEIREQERITGNLIAATNLQKSKTEQLQPLQISWKAFGTRQKTAVPRFTTYSLTGTKTARLSFWTEAKKVSLTGTTQT